MNKRNTERALLMFLRQWLAQSNPHHPLLQLEDAQLINKLERDWNWKGPV